MPEFARCFTLLKSREKLKEQEKIWKNICQDLNWRLFIQVFNLLRYYI
jgi:hypothetical protein